MFRTEMKVPMEYYWPILKELEVMLIKEEVSFKEDFLKLTLRMATSFKGNLKHQRTVRSILDILTFKLMVN